MEHARAGRLAVGDSSCSKVVGVPKQEIQIVLGRDDGELGRRIGPLPGAGRAWSGGRFERSLPGFANLRSVSADIYEKVRHSAPEIYIHERPFGAVLLLDCRTRSNFARSQGETSPSSEGREAGCARVGQEVICDVFLGALIGEGSGDEVESAW